MDCSDLPCGPELRSQWSLCRPPMERDAVAVQEECAVVSVLFADPHHAAVKGKHIDLASGDGEAVPAYFHFV
ncbi:hypothetical protein [Pseudarthrobacter defluvii]|uniref:hypothetical protein n=1 Tax=Pseudarthrobacter defluvii TaxID=410837 RepID=UPI002577260E|nr:hypothetical protein [Pseudarthrobacter defluvii]WJH24319.1 hypothetical protein JCQ34_18255 [Pseudarthrobacter defluvii]